MKEIQLTQGKSALVDDTDYERVNRFKWHAINNHGFRATRVVTVEGRQTTIHMSRFIMNCTDPNLFVDHINHNTLDNRRDNLRVCTAKENQWNKIKERTKQSSPYKGVFVRAVGNRLRISARIRINGRLKQIGDFKTLEDAAHAYDQAAVKYFGEFACVNFPIRPLAMVA
jgi:hypothetical protein